LISTVKIKLDGLKSKQCVTALLLYGGKSKSADVDRDGGVPMRWQPGGGKDGDEL
jgi:hypothetical protein